MVDVTQNEVVCKDNQNNEKPSIISSINFSEVNEAWAPPPYKTMNIGGKMET